MSTQPARGMRDFLPEDVRRRQYVIGVIADVYQKYGLEEKDFVSLLKLAHMDQSPAYLAKVGEERFLLALLPRGLPEARSRFPRLSFRSVRDPAVLSAGSPPSP